MYIKHRDPAHLVHAPRSFAALMELYELNYIALRCLCPRLPAEGELWVSSPEGAPRLYLKLLEQTRYTSSLELTHCFDVAPGEETETPSLCVRIYHDARQAEVLLTHRISSAGQSKYLIDTREGELRVRWSANRFLNRWLNYCLGQGHVFPDKTANHFV